jgi:ADP-ribose pyrophosphatase
MALPKTNTMKITSSVEKYRCRLFWITEDEARDATGWNIKRSVVRHFGSAVMMAVDKKDRVLLVRQYRLPANQFLWELPAGKVDKGETVFQAAKRELIEETGVSEPRLCRREDDDLSRQRPHRGRITPHG